jgi:hypothetical protein
MAKLPSISMLTIACALLFMFIIHQQASSARTIGNPTPTPRKHYHKITFLMRDVLINVTQPSSKPATAKVTSTQLPFPKPLGLFPPNGGIPVLLGSNPTVPGTAAGLSTQTLDLSAIGLSFPASATLQELEFGTVTVIDQELFKGSSKNNMSPMLGKAQGIYVASSEDGSSHMMAMTAYFAGSDGFKDGLRFFGVHQTDVPESHIAVVGGIGKYQGANGYAKVKAVDDHVGSHTDEEGKGTNKLLLFHVYLS